MSPGTWAIPVLVIWALAWNCSQLLAILSGDASRAVTYFDANIFSPAPHTLAYSEHFIGQAVQVLPVYALTGNAVLCYNLLYLSTFVLSGLGGVSVRPRAHRQPRGRLQRRPVVRVRAVSLSAVVAPAGAVVAVDAVRPLRLPPLLRHRPAPCARRRRGRTDRAEPFVRLLPALFLAVRRRLHPGRVDGARAVALGAGVAGPRGRGRSRHGGHGAVLPAVSLAPGAPAVNTVADRSGPLLRRHLLLPDCVCRASDVGPGRAGVSEAGGATVPWTRGRAARHGRDHSSLAGQAPTKEGVRPRQLPPGIGGRRAPPAVRRGAVRAQVRVRLWRRRRAHQRRHAAAASRRHRVRADPGDQPARARASRRASGGRGAHGCVALLAALWLSLGPSPTSMGRPLDLVRAVSGAVRAGAGVRRRARAGAVLDDGSPGALGARRLRQRASRAPASRYRACSPRMAVVPGRGASRLRSSSTAPVRSPASTPRSHGFGSETTPRPFTQP